MKKYLKILGLVLLVIGLTFIYGYKKVLIEEDQSQYFKQNNLPDWWLYQKDSINNIFDEKIIHIDKENCIITTVKE